MGTVSIVFGSIALFLTVMGIFTCGVTYVIAVPLAALGGLLALLGRGNTKTTGLLLNLLALVPAIILAMGLFGGLAGLIQGSR
jgi:hypothetical protein